MVENNEVERAVSALTVELLKLSPQAEGDEQNALSVTISNAITRLAHAILEQASQSAEKSVEDAMPAAV